jgi:hypothetical protein
MTALPTCKRLHNQSEPVPLQRRPELLNSGLVLNPSSDRTAAAVPLDRETLLARFDGIRQFARGGWRVRHKPLLLLYALAPPEA